MSDDVVNQNPIHRKYYRYLAYIMTFCSIGKLEWWGYEPNKNIFISLHAKAVIFFVPIFFTLEIFYGYQYFNILREYNVTLLYLIAMAFSTNTLIKICMSQTDGYRDCLTSLMNEIHLYHFKDKDGFNKKKAVQVERWLKYCHYILGAMLFLCGICWAVIPFGRNVYYRDLANNKTIILRSSIYIWMPFDTLFNLKNWIIYEVVLVFYLQLGACLIVYCLDIMTFTCMFHFIGHLYIVKHRLENQIWHDLSDSEVRAALIDVINYHGFIKRYFTKIEAAYSVNIAVNYLQNLTVDSMLMYQFMFGDKDLTFTHLLMAFYFLACLMLLSYTVEEIRKLSEDLSNTIYFCPWQSMSSSNQKVLLLLLVQSQNPMEIRSCGFSFGYQPMINIFKTTFSYYIMLKETSQ